MCCKVDKNILREKLEKYDTEGQLLHILRVLYHKCQFGKNNIRIDWRICNHNCCIGGMCALIFQDIHTIIKEARLGNKNVINIEQEYRE